MMFLVYLVFPIIEIYLLFLSSKAIGFFPVLGIVILTAWFGSRLVKSQGLLVLSQFQRRMNDGHIPKLEAIEGLLVLIAGILLIAPGFITDFIGTLCLIPTTRHIFAGFLAKWVERKIKFGQIKVYSNSSFSGAAGGFRSEPSIRDVTPKSVDELPKS